MPSTSPERERLLRRAYAAFNARDVEAVVALLHSDVDWPNVMEGTRAHGHAAVRGYWTRQFEVIDSHVEPVGFDEDGEGRVIVEVHQVVRDMDGNVTDDTTVAHVYSFRDGLVARMDVHPWPGPSSP
jgi:ketosteroid isomerase-like protein